MPVPGKRGRAIRFFHAEHDAPTVQTLQVVGERADRLQNLRDGGLGIPTRLELYPIRLHHETGQKIF